MVTEELTMRKAAPVSFKRLLQLKNVADGTPMITSDAMLLMLTVDSIKMSGLRMTLEALALWTAKAIVLHGNAARPQVLESVPFRGLTMTEVTVSTVVAPAEGNVDATQQKAKIDAHKRAALNGCGCK